MKVYLYGSGKRCEILLSIMKESCFQVVGIIDSNLEKQGCRIDEYTVEPPTVLIDSVNELVCVTFFSPLEHDPIWDDLRVKYGIDENRIISFHQMVIRAYEENDKLLENSRNILFGKEKKYCFDVSWKMGLGGVESWLLDLRKEFDKQRHEEIEWLEYENDYFVGHYGLFETDMVKAGTDRIIRSMPSTIVFSRVDEMMLSAFLLKKRLPYLIKIIMAVHGACDGMYKDILSYREGIDYYVCVSSGIKDELINFGVDESKISVMTIPVDYKERASDEYSLDNKNPIRLGYAGRLEVFHKRADLLIELLKEVEMRKINYKLYIAGEGSCYSAIQNYIDKHFLNKKVTLLGRVDRNAMADFWSDKDVALNLSDSEGRPLSNMEAMAGGCVPVVTCTSGSVEDVENGINGFVVPKGDIGAMADKINYLDKNRGLLPMYGQKAKESILPKISKKRHLDLWMNLFQTI